MEKPCVLGLGSPGGPSLAPPGRGTRGLGRVSLLSFLWDGSGTGRARRASAVPGPRCPGSLLPSPPESREPRRPSALGLSLSLSPRRCFLSLASFSVLKPILPKTVHLIHGFVYLSLNSRSLLARSCPSSGLPKRPCPCPHASWAPGGRGGYGGDSGQCRAGVEAGSGGAQRQHLSLSRGPRKASWRRRQGPGGEKSSGRG